MFRLEGVENPIGCYPSRAERSRVAAFRSQCTIRNAGTGRCEKIGSAAGRVARNGKSWWRRVGVSPRCNTGT